MASTKCTLPQYCELTGLRYALLLYRQKNDDNFPTPTDVFGNVYVYSKKSLDDYFVNRPVQVKKKSEEKPGNEVGQQENTQGSFDAAGINAKLDLLVDCFKALNADIEDLKGRINSLKEQMATSSADAQLAKDLEDISNGVFQHE